VSRVLVAQYVVVNRGRLIKGALTNIPISLNPGNYGLGNLSICIYGLSRLVEYAIA